MLLAEGIDPVAILPALSTISSVGFAIWYSWYVTTVAFPRREAESRAEREEMQRRFDACLQVLTEELKQVRLQKTKQMLRVANGQASDDDSNDTRPQSTGSSGIHS